MTNEEIKALKAERDEFLETACVNLARELAAVGVVMPMPAVYGSEQRLKQYRDFQALKG